MNGRFLTLAGIGLLLAACGSAQPPPSQTEPPPVSLSPASTVSEVKPAPSSTRPTTSPATEPAEIFFATDGKLAAEQAQLSGPAPARQALQVLLDGPKQPQHLTEIPKSTQLQDVSVKDGLASVSFDSGFYAPSGASGVLLRLAQVVYTLTQFPGVSAVQFLQDGRPVGLIGEGFPLNRPLTRMEFAHVQP